MRATSDGGIVSVVIDHPPTNLLDGSLLEGLRSLLDHLAQEPSVRVVIFRSADPDFFVMHGDVELLVGLHPPVTPWWRRTPPPPPCNASPWRPSSASGCSTGPPAGVAAKCCVPWMCGSEPSGPVIGQPEVAMGILPGAGGTARWPRLVGRSRALDILLTGRDVQAAELLALGWLLAMGPPERIEEELAAFVARMRTDARRIGGRRQARARRRPGRPRRRIGGRE